MMAFSTFVLGPDQADVLFLFSLPPRSDRSVAPPFLHRLRCLTSSRVPPPSDGQVPSASTKSISGEALKPKLESRRETADSWRCFLEVLNSDGWCERAILGFPKLAQRDSEGF